MASVAHVRHASPVGDAVTVGDAVKGHTMNTRSDTMWRTSMPSPIGELTIVATDSAVVAIRWDTESDGRQPDAHNPVDRVLGDRFVDVGHGEHAVLDRAVDQLGEYFDGVRIDFDLPLDPTGTIFQRDAWETLRSIPFGETITYGEQARRLGDKNKSRAVGAANGRNPIPIVVPCHRVVGSNGHLTGFAGGIGIKAWLLDHELRVRAS
jgi:methylated-DNA-[protein]-cysteine S-methyltransferase